MAHGACLREVSGKPRKTTRNLKLTSQCQPIPNKHPSEVEVSLVEVSSRKNGGWELGLNYYFSRVKLEGLLHVKHVRVTDSFNRDAAIDSVSHLKVYHEKWEDLSKSDVRLQ